MSGIVSADFRNSSLIVFIYVRGGLPAPSFFKFWDSCAGNAVTAVVTFYRIVEEFYKILLE
jgi:hypothetical protein